MHYRKKNNYKVAHDLELWITVNNCCTFFKHSAKGTRSWEKAVTKFVSQLAYQNLEIDWINIYNTLSNFDTVFSKLKSYFFKRRKESVDRKENWKKRSEKDVKDWLNTAWLSANFLLRNDQNIFLDKKVRNRINIP